MVMTQAAAGLGVQSAKAAGASIAGGIVICPELSGQRKRWAGVRDTGPRGRVRALAVFKTLT
jgi:hypothetical protein